MIDTQLIADIMDVYVKHGWELRRVLLSEPASDPIANIATVVGNVPIGSGKIDGLWFARDRADGDTAWELRHISAAPFALVAVVTEGTDDVEASLDEIEDNMAETLASKLRGH